MLSGDEEILPVGTYRYELDGGDERIVHFEGIERWVSEERLAGGQRLVTVRYDGRTYRYRPGGGAATVRDAEGPHAPWGWVFDPDWLAGRIDADGRLADGQLRGDLLDEGLVVPDALTLPGGQEFDLVSFTGDLERDPAEEAARLETSADVELHPLDDEEPSERGG